MGFNELAQKEMEKYTKYFNWEIAPGGVYFLDKKPYNPIKKEQITYIENMNARDKFHIYNFLCEYKKAVKRAFKKEWEILFSMGCDCNYDNSLKNKVLKNIEYNIKIIGNID